MSTFYLIIPVEIIFQRKMESSLKAGKLKLGSREFKPKVKDLPEIDSGSKYFKGVLPQMAAAHSQPPSMLPPGFEIKIVDGKVKLPPGLPTGLEKMFMKAYEDGKFTEFLQEKQKKEMELSDLTEEEEAMAEEFLAEQKEIEMCPFYLQGTCKYGKKWANFHPSDIDEFSNNVQFYGDREWGIWMEFTLAKDRQFGLLDGWEHAFCLDCIRNWRATYIKRMKKEFMRWCPLCRQLSYLVIPSSKYLPGGEAKQQLVEEYQEVLSEIPCRHFNYGKGECPFLNSCFYAHYTKDGKKFEYNIKVSNFCELDIFLVYHLLLSRFLLLI